MARKVKFSDGKIGAALPVRVIPRASRNEIAEILADHTVKVRLVSTANEQETNQELIGFLSEVLGVPASKMEIVAGNSGRDKLVSILDITSLEVHQRILGHLA
ncbi:MAG: DUF167 domain-containing protein [Anaerolineales bacterium]|nr:DUF167 domain-containing protein [Anaerolineales bacterium]